MQNVCTSNHLNWQKIGPMDKDRGLRSSFKWWVYITFLWSFLGIIEILKLLKLLTGFWMVMFPGTLKCLFHLRCSNHLSWKKMLQWIWILLTECSEVMGSHNIWFITTISVTVSVTSSLLFKSKLWKQSYLQGIHIHAPVLLKLYSLTQPSHGLVMVWYA